jgi:hypothetical protein
MRGVVRTAHWRLSLVWMTPFGKPVVPEVYMMNTGSLPAV